MTSARQTGWLACFLVACGCGRIGFDAMEMPPGVSTLAGGSSPGLQDGSGSGAQFDNPVNLAVGPDGKLYVADHANDAIRVVTPAGQVTTLVAGSPDMTYPFGLAFAGDGSLIVGTDFGEVINVDIATGSMTVRARGLSSVRGVVELTAGRIVYANWTTDGLHILDASGAVSTLAGGGGEGYRDGSGANALFNEPTDVVQRADGAMLVADLNNHRVRLVELDGTTTTYAGAGIGYDDGPVLTARFNGSGALALASDGTLYVSDRFNRVIRRITPDGIVTTIAGNGVAGFADAEDPLQASLNDVEGLDLSADERVLYFVDGNGGSGTLHHRIRRLVLPP